MVQLRPYQPKPTWRDATPEVRQYGFDAATSTRVDEDVASIQEIADQMARFHRLDAFLDTLGSAPFIQKSFMFDEANDAIRLCNIVPDCWNAHIQCTLSTPSTKYGLERLLAYRCLSYVWDDARNPPSIAMNGKTLTVTDNLRSALRRLRQMSLTGPWWIDAFLCIDQRNEAEKTREVSRMNEIFANAVEVLVWLGEPQSTTTSHGDIIGAKELACNALLVFHDLAGDKHFHQLSFVHRCRARTCPATTSIRHRSSWDHAFESLKAWMSSTWFDRLETVQEVVLAQSSMFMFGASPVSWKVMAGAWTNFARHVQTCCSDCVFQLEEEHSRALAAFAASLIDLENLIHSRTHEQDIPELLIQFHDRSTSEPKDKVYALRGLQAGPNKVAMRLNNAFSLAECLTAFATALVASRGMLVTFGLDLTKQEAMALPSWVPDWSVKAVKCCGVSQPLLQMVPHVSRCRLYALRYQHHHRWSLSTCGILVDPVQKISTACRTSKDPRVHAPNVDK